MAYTEWKNLESVDRYAKKRYRSWDQRRLDQRERKLVEKIFRDYHLSGTILDVPVGYGRFQSLLSEFGSVIAADIGFFPLLYEKQYHGIDRYSVNCSATNLPFSDNSADIVFCFRLMQHLHEKSERIAVLKEFKRVSRNWVIISEYLSNFFHQTYRAIIRQKSKITILTSTIFEEEIKSAELFLLKKFSVVPGFHANRICLLSTRKPS